MDLFLEFALTIVVSLLFSFALAKLLSLSSTDDSERDSVLGSCKEVFGQAGKQEGKLDADCRSYGFESEMKLGFALKVGEVDELTRARQEKFILEELFNDSCGSPKAHINERKTKENEVLREVEIAAVMEKKDTEEICTVGEENLSDESAERGIVGKSDIDLLEDKVDVAESAEEVEVFDREGDKGIEGSERKGEHCVEDLFVEDDDWEGIERNELEGLFGSAVAFVGSRSNADCISRLETNEKMQLYGLHKIAIEGPCHETQPMAFKVSARAKWNAWHQLGNMSPEVAMERYINLLSRSLPDWIRDGTSGESNQVLADTAENGRNLDEVNPHAEDLGISGSAVQPL